MPTRRQVQLAFLELEEAGQLALDWLVIAAIVALTGLFLWWCLWSFSPPLQRHSGVIVAKEIRFSETCEGSLVGNYLLIEELSGEKKWVRVTDDVYYKAKVGMQARVGDGPAELNEPRSTIRSPH
ncbi:MAG TPA: hypothetical protein VFV34_22525 [Blastocatellia bacterium]|nr:hypothetical protein [Blastocatellia bacterium]